MRRSRTIGLEGACAIALLGSMAVPQAFAQQPAPQAVAAPTPASERCGGLLCDAYYTMNPNARPGATTLPCHDFVCGMFGGQTVTPAPTPVAQQMEAAPPAPAHTAHRHKHHAAHATKTTAAASPAADPAAPVASAR